MQQEAGVSWHVWIVRHPCSPSVNMMMLTLLQTFSRFSRVDKKTAINSQWKSCHQVVIQYKIRMFNPLR